MTGPPLIFSALVVVAAFAWAAFSVRRRTGRLPGMSFGLVLAGSLVVLVLMTGILEGIPEALRIVLSVFATSALVGLAAYRAFLANRSGHLDTRLIVLMVLGALTVALSVFNAVRRQ